MIVSDTKMTINIRDEVFNHYLNLYLQNIVNQNIKFKNSWLGDLEIVVEVCEVKFIELTHQAAEFSIFLEGLTFPSRVSQFSLRGSLLFTGTFSLLESGDWFQPKIEIRDIVWKEPPKARLGSRSIKLKRLASWLLRLKKTYIENNLNQGLIDKLKPELIEEKLKVRSAWGKYNGKILGLKKLETQIQNLEMKTGLLQLQVAANLTLEMDEIKPVPPLNTRVSKVKIYPSVGKLTVEMTYAEVMTLINANIELINNLLHSKKVQLKRVDILGSESGVLVFRISLEKPISDVLEVRCEFALDQSKHELTLKELEVTSSKKTKALTRGLVWLTSGRIESYLRKLFPISLEQAVVQLNLLLQQNDWGLLKWEGELTGIDCFETIDSLVICFSKKSIWSVRAL